MAAYTGIKHSKHATLTPSTVDTLTIVGAVSHLEILNRSTSDTIYFRLDGIDPTVGGDDTLVLPAATAWDRRIPVHAPKVVKLISSGNAAYSVQGINE